METQKILEFRPAPIPRDQFKVRPSPLAVFSVGRDAEVLQKRAGIIGADSDLTVLSMTPEEANKWVRSEDPHLWVFCSTIELSMLVHLACAIRRHSPGSRLLLMEGARRAGFEKALFHWTIQPADGPEILAEAVSHLAVAV
ncbi:MAG: hypothetical protein WA414_00810 [Acidobacteriaceae bacterium]